MTLLEICYKILKVVTRERFNLFRVPPGQPTCLGQMDCDDSLDFTQPTQLTQPTQQLSQYSAEDAGAEEHSDNSPVKLGCLIPTPGFPGTPIERVWITDEKAELCIGRDPVCDIVIADDRISKRHCRVYVETKRKSKLSAKARTNLPDFFYIEDTSSNGTYVNGHRLQPHKPNILMPGDDIRLGPPPTNQKQPRINLIFQGPPRPTVPVVYDSNDINYKYEIHNKTLGTGNFGTVCLASNRSTGNLYACKIIDKNKFWMQSKVEEAIRREVAILRRMKHPHIVTLVDMYDNEKTIYLVMELVSGGDLVHYMNEKEPRPGEFECRNFTRQICLAVQYMHRENIVHRDLKPDNILLTEDIPPLLKVTDFGLAKVADHISKFQTACGTPTYLAPEIIKKDETSGYGKAVDIWSLGVVVYWMLIGRPPFDVESSQESLYESICAGKIDYRPFQELQLSDEAVSFAKGLLRVDPKERMTADQALQHPWLQGLPEVTPIQEFSEEHGDQSWLKRDYSAATASTSKPQSRAWGWLVLIENSMMGENVALIEKNITIGRSRGCHIRFNYPRMSGLQCTISNESGRYFIRDNSINGVYLNDQRLECEKKQEIKDGDIIGILIEKYRPEDFIKYKFKTQWDGDLPQPTYLAETSATGPPPPSPKAKRIRAYLLNTNDHTIIHSTPPWAKLESLNSLYPDFALSEQIVKIGRQTDCPAPLRFKDNRVSGHHCIIEHTSDGPVLTDLSFNGTFINGKKLGKGNSSSLQSGDEIVILYSTEDTEKPATSRELKISIGYTFTLTSG
ncbi:uncharacterized protein VTP21DRAFT_551 [Calcarisporiella thermophila]|uniref:uncharacterized protein n=1 Tax=Calcarisporiella thermophila TaxID=911321 RepID=UPI003742D40B